MSFWSSQKLEANLNNIIDNGEPSLVDCNAITLRIGNEIYITPSLEQPAPNSHTKQLLDATEAFTVPPGQFAFLLTEEIVTIPPDTMGFISIKTTYKLKGLVNVSGFHVDPGWSGPLIFAVFNAGPAPVHLERGLPVFLLWLADLDQPSAKRKTTPGPAGIPPSKIDNITGVVDSIYALEKRIRDELQKLSDIDEELSNRMHAMDKTYHRVLLGLGIGGVVLAALIGVAMKTTVMSFLDPLVVTQPAIVSPALPEPVQTLPSD